MRKEYKWWVQLGNKIKINLNFSYWNPLEEIELRRSICISRLYYGTDVPFIEVIIAFLFIKMEWYLYIDKI